MNAEMMLFAIIAITILAVVPAGVVYFMLNKSQKKEQEEAVDSNLKSKELILTAQNKAKQIVLDAKAEALKIREKAEKESDAIRKKALEVETNAQKRMDELTKKNEEITKREKEVEDMQKRIQQSKKDVENLRKKEIEKLQSISSLTKDEARKMILDNVEKTLTNEIAKKIKEAYEQMQISIDQQAKQLLIDTMHNASTDYVAEYTISTVKLPDPDMKGRIIGKEGRNIRAFEDATGVNVDFDGDTEIRLSSFDSVRREIAKRSMEKLIKDGRIQPARIEEIVKKTQEEVDKIIMEAGEELCTKVGVYNLPKDIVYKLGSFKFRTSYGQNMIQHTLEETQMGVKIAHEIGANVTVTKLACLLHDIGKVITDKEGSHIELGAEFLRKYNLPESVITAVAEHHSDDPSTIEGTIVQIADSISGSRPGARYEDFESYVKRLRSLEEKAKVFEGVEKAYAISAGREVRVIVKPEEINDAEAVKLSHDIAKKIEEEETYPGTVKVLVIRETRSIATAA